MTKRCSKCGEEKPVGEFYRRGDGGYRDHYRSKCKACFSADGESVRHAESRRARHNADPERLVLRLMINRCHNPKNPGFINYGARGIVVCDRWRNSYEAFLEDMGRRPGPLFSIERIDNDRGYEPGNCKWATRTEQNRNTRQNVLLTAFGKTQCVTAWAEELGISAQLIRNRLRRRGWTVKAALTTPPAPMRHGGLTIDGRTQSVFAWAREAGLPPDTVHWRLAHGWDPGRALTTPQRVVRRRERKAA